MDNLTVEYAILIDDEDSFCDSENALLSFLDANSRLKINRNKSTISYTTRTNKSIEIEYKISIDRSSPEGTTKCQRIFRTIFIQKSLPYDGNFDPKEFIDFLRTFKRDIQKLDIDIYNLSNDISFYYASAAYPKIHKIENLLRQLILRFLLKNFGSDWVENTFGEEISRDISTRTDIKTGRNDGKNRRDEESVLHKIDFKDLSTFLVKPYRSIKLEEIERKIRDANSLEDLNLEELKSYLPKSNWSRYFAGEIAYEESQFKKNWEELYRLRCKVAHNNLVQPQDYERILEITSELEPKINDALKKIQEIEIPEEEKEEVKQNISSNVEYVILFEEPENFLNSSKFVKSWMNSLWCNQKSYLDREILEALSKLIEEKAKNGSSEANIYLKMLSNIMKKQEAGNPLLNNDTRERTPEDVSRKKSTENVRESGEEE